MENKIKFMAANNPKTDYAGQSVDVDFLYKDIAIVAPNTAVLCEVNSEALRIALLNSPELLAIWGLELKPIVKKEKEKPAPKKDPEPEEAPKED